MVWLLVGSALALSGCSATRLVYGQGPTALYWWIDGQLDLNDAQTPALRQDIDAFFVWHQREELPAYAALLQGWQAQVPQDISPDEACAAFEQVRQRLRALSAHSVPPLARLALQLTPEQLTYLAKAQAKSRDKFKDEWLDGSADERLRKRLDSTVERSEDFYGPLTSEQRDLLRSWLQRSPFDPNKSLSERQRRQADLRETIGRMQALAGTPAPAAKASGVLSSAVAAPLAAAPSAQAEAELRAYHERLWQSSDTAQRQHSQAWQQHSCAQFSALHNSTSAAQRARAVESLKGYEADARALMRPS